MDINLNPRIPRIIAPRDLDRRGGCIPPSRHRDLIATHVELRTTGLSSRVEGQRLRAKQVVAALDITGDLDVHLAAALVQVARAPVVVVPDGTAGFLGPGVRKDLEPARRAIGLGGVGDLGQVDLYGAPVGAADGFVVTAPVAGLLVHLDGHAAAGLDAADTADTAGAACVAGEVTGANICDGGVGGGHADAGGSIIGSVDPELLEDGVAGYLVGSDGRRESGYEGGLHDG